MTKDISVTRTISVGPVYKCTLSISRNGMKAQWEPVMPSKQIWNSELMQEYRAKRDEAIKQYSELNDLKVAVLE